MIAKEGKTYYEIASEYNNYFLFIGKEVNMHTITFYNNETKYGPYLVNEKFTLFPEQRMLVAKIMGVPMYNKIVLREGTKFEKSSSSEEYLKIMGSPSVELNIEL